MFEFDIKSSYRKARLGSFNTPHGEIQTPNIYFYKRLFQEIREAIIVGKLEKLEKEYSVYL